MIEKESKTFENYFDMIFNPIKNLVREGKYDFRTFDQFDDLDQIIGKNTWLKIELVEYLLPALDPLVEWIDDQSYFDVLSVRFSADYHFEKVS
mgnify:CR=1 FL=1